MLKTQPPLHVFPTPQISNVVMAKHTFDTCLFLKKWYRAILFDGVSNNCLSSFFWDLIDNFYKILTDMEYETGQVFARFEGAC